MRYGLAYTLYSLSKLRTVSLRYGFMYILTSGRPSFLARMGTLGW